MQNKEIERKFLIEAKNLPNLSTFNYMDISQGYMSDLSETHMYRLRQVLHYTSDKTVAGEEYFQTIKGHGSKIRMEFEINILHQQFHKLWSLCESLTIHKHRFKLTPPENPNIHYYLDVYKHEFAGLYTVEVEFNTEEECDEFIPPDWFGVELTEDKRFTNYQLAKNGLKNIIGYGYTWKCVDCGAELGQQISHTCVDNVENNDPTFVFSPSDFYADSDEPWNLRK